MNRYASLFFVFALALSLLVLPQETQAAEQPARPTLSVEGTGEANAAPDQATVAIGITTHAADAAKAQNDNAWTAAQIQNAIAALGIDAKDIQTQNYSFRPTYRTEENRRSEINGYTVDNTVLVCVRDIKLTGKVVDAALSHGANEISSLSFTASDARALRKVALKNAIADARDKADIIAQGLGKRIVGIQTVSENTGYPETRRYVGNMMLAAKDAATPIQPGSLTLTANVHIDFLLSD